MTHSELEGLKKWFANYTRSFLAGKDEDRKNISLKIEHTLEVCDIISRLAAEEGLSPHNAVLAEAVALFHDIGRFPQYARWRTFWDKASTNHGELGAKVLIEEGVLAGLPPEEQGIILHAVKYHNAFRMPSVDGPGAVLFLKLVRDADKLDIWRILFEYFEEDAEERASAVGLGLSDTPGYSDEIVRSINEKRSASLSNVKNMNDFKLLSLSWVFDLNFRASFRRLLEKGYIDRMAASLPESDDIGEAVDRIRQYAIEMSKQARSAIIGA